ncbi:hypothetical protein Mal64_02290 [Pseudobythopirellula maris]|uniref:PPM-type phosphatase domain-containing protein n=1 Tax=Pseudobythopirellula maris TaxID=2527991 RepID=A0A5C5ZS22_9BACT|nr:PP2C family serine/threonine-protein phosphatase [Pseudobythopirellula maris]TWT89848.1 hypothetical protein Mal64_02290 [Pseudobythopirellula maris]
MWQSIGQSVQGQSHAAKNEPCQDSKAVRVLGDGATLVACVADGAGSAKHSDLGSSIACDTVAEKSEELFEADPALNSLDRQMVLDWCELIRARLFEEADRRECASRELATTLCAALLSADRAVFFQIGDGAIVLSSGGVQGVVFWPQSGEYANSTNFLTADDYADHLEFISIERPFTEVALLTDGIERIALSFEGQTPHAPFFQPLFNAIRSTAEPLALETELSKFLDSESVRVRSDDDKTLVLAAQVVAG